MTGATTLGNAESGSTAKLDGNAGIAGYRWWVVENGKLISPFASVVLPPNGIATDVSYYATRADLDRVAKYLDPRAAALTIGTITGTTRPDPEPQTYDIGKTKVRLPDAWIGQHYCVTRIITNAPVLYPIPVQRWTA